MSELLPREIECSLRQFLIEGRTGQLVLHIKDGSVQFAKVTETVTVDRSKGVRVER